MTEPCFMCIKSDFHVTEAPLEQWRFLDNIRVIPGYGRWHNDTCHMSGLSNLHKQLTLKQC